MPEPPTLPDRATQLTRLEQLYRDGVLTEDLYRAALAGLSIGNSRYGNFRYNLLKLASSFRKHGIER